MLLRTKPPVIEPTKPTYEVEITGKTEAQKLNRDIRKQKKNKSVGKNNVLKSREKSVLCNNVTWDDADDKVKRYKF